MPSAKQQPSNIKHRDLRHFIIFVEFMTANVLCLKHYVIGFFMVSPKRIGPLFLPLSIAYCKDNREADLVLLN